MKQPLGIRSSGGVAVALALLTALGPIGSQAQLRNWGRPVDRDIASVHVALQSIAPFEDYIATLQPTFKITAESARLAAIAQTRRQTTETKRELEAAIEAALIGGGGAAPADAGTAPPATTPPATPGTTPGAPGTTPATPGTPAPATPAPATPTTPATTPATTTPPPVAAVAAAAAAAISETTDLDAFVTYNAGTSLFQYVGLLNAYVRDAAVVTGTRPYIVRLLVSVLPTAASRGYDAYSTVSFFSEPGPTSDGRLVKSQWAQGLDTQRQNAENNLRAAKECRRKAWSTSEYQGAESLINEWKSELAGLWEDQRLIDRLEREHCRTEPLRVIPLLVTDNIEASLHSDALERIRELSANISSAGQRTTLAGRIRSRLEDASKTLTRNLNGLMTVTQVAGNSIQVRLGAMYGNRVDAMIPRTYGVTLLVLLPTAERMDRSAARIQSQIIPCAAGTFTADTFFRNGRTGQLARRTSDEDAFRIIRTVEPETSWADAEKLFRAVREDDFDAFLDLVPDEVRAVELWSRLVATLSTTSTSRGRFQASFRRVELFTTDMTASVIDDGKFSTLRLVGGLNLVPDRIAGTLRVKLKSSVAAVPQSDDPSTCPGATPPTASSPSRLVVLNSSEVEVSNDGRMATLTFPSIHALVKAQNVEAVMPEVRYQRGVRDWQTTRPQERNADLDQVWKPDEPAAYVGPLEEPKPEAPKAAFTMTSSVKSIFVRKNLGSVKIRFERDPKAAKLPMFFSVTPGDVLRVDPNVPLEGKAWKVVEEREYTIDLDNLTVGSTVTITSSRADETDITDPKKRIAGDTLTFEVRPRR